MMNKVMLSGVFALCASPVLPATYGPDTLSPHVLNFAGENFIVGTVARVTGRAFDSDVQNLKMAPYVEKNDDGSYRASCVLVGNPSVYHFTDADDNVMEPARYQNPYTRIYYDGDIRSALFNGGFQIQDPQLTFVEGSIDMVVGGEMPDGTNISAYMSQPSNMAGYRDLLSLLAKPNSSFDIQLISQYDHTQVSHYETRDLSSSFTACSEFLNSPAQVEELAAEATTVLRVDTAPVAASSLLQSGIETTDEQRAFKRSLLGKSCSARQYSDFEMDAVNLVEVVRQTGFQATSLYGVNYTDNHGTQITAIGDYYKKEVFADGTIKISGSLSTDNPINTSCQGGISVSSDSQSYIVYELPQRDLVTPISETIWSSYTNIPKITGVRDTPFWEEKDDGFDIVDCNCFVVTPLTPTVSQVDLPASIFSLMAGMIALGAARNRQIPSSKKRALI